MRSTDEAAHASGSRHSDSVRAIRSMPTRARSSAIAPYANLLMSRIPTERRVRVRQQDVLARIDTLLLMLERHW